MKPKHDNIDFHVVRSEYAERKLELLRKTYLRSMYVYDAGDYPEAILCFQFLMKELDTVISSADPCCFINASDLVRSLQDYISFCNQRLLDMRKSSCL